ncbi:MAG TPA: hypothetical protein VK392_01925 [Thermoanaerobaculia bacterium]|jgi:hypothetical protein|nr:hypothetical protein [Thermoanaerobaculia bacterium]
MTIFRHLVCAVLLAFLKRRKAVVLFTHGEDNRSRLSVDYFFQ